MSAWPAPYAVQPFSLTQRKHTCRKCNLTFCNACSTHKFTLLKLGWPRTAPVPTHPRAMSRHYLRAGPHPKG